MYVLILEFYIPQFFVVVLFAQLRYLVGNNTRCFLPCQLKKLVSNTLQLTYTGLVLVARRRRKSTKRVNYYVVNSRYMLNIRPKLFKNELPVHYPLIFTQGHGIDQIIMI